VAVPGPVARMELSDIRDGLPRICCVQFGLPSCHGPWPCYAHKPASIDFVGNSKISSFSQKPPPNRARWHSYTFIELAFALEFPDNRENLREFTTLRVDQGIFSAGIGNSSVGIGS
jgi:hypothetical protein